MKYILALVNDNIIIALIISLINVGHQWRLRGLSFLSTPWTMVMNKF